MKKATILSLCVLVGATAFGQSQAVKDAEKAMKSKKPYTEVVKIITPAFNDPASAKSIETYYIPGKAGFDTYDQIFIKETLGTMTDQDRKDRAEALIGGYEYLIQALPLDSIPNEKGKVNPKKSKDIISTIGGHYSDFDRVAVDFWNLQDYDNAYAAWDIYCTLPYDARFKKAINPAPADTIVANAMFNRSLAAYNSGDMKKALNSFVDTKNHGYDKKSVYDLAIAAARNLEDNDAMMALCEEAIPLYGNEDPTYITLIINKYTEDKDYKKAADLINDALAKDPNNPQYHMLLGILYEQEGVGGDAKGEFKKAVDLDNNNCYALYNLGRSILYEAMVANDNAPTDPEAYYKAFNSSILPLLKDSIVYLEKAWEVNNDLDDALKLLEQAYYLANDDANLKYTQDRLKY